MKFTSLDLNVEKTNYMLDIGPINLAPISIGLLPLSWLLSHPLLLWLLTFILALHNSNDLFRATNNMK